MFFETGTIDQHIRSSSRNIPQSISFVPERSSPDGGEVFDASKGNAREGTDSCSSIISGFPADDDRWSDWEDSPCHSARSPFSTTNYTPADVSHLRVNEEEQKQQSGDTLLQPLPYVPHCSSSIQDASSSTLPFSSSNNGCEVSDNNTLRGTILPSSKSNTSPFKHNNSSSDNVTNPEFDLLAELAPRITLKEYNLESMLTEASLKSKSNLHYEVHSEDIKAVKSNDNEVQCGDSVSGAVSLSTTLADMHCASMENEGDEWNEDLLLDLSSNDE